MKKAVHSFLLILMLLLLPTAFASAVEAPPINEISDDVSFVEWFNFLRSDDYSFSYVSAGIKGGDGCVYVTGETETNKKVACVGGFAAIQRWENNHGKHTRNLDLIGMMPVVALLIVLSQLIVDTTTVYTYIIVPNM